MDTGKAKRSAIERHRAALTSALATEAGKTIVQCLREAYVDVDLLGATERETTINVCRRDVVFYLMEIGGIKDGIT